MHEPQFTVREPPQLSNPVKDPQFLLWLPQKAWSDSGVHPQVPSWPPPPQVWGAAQPPQSSVLPQLSEIVPQPTPCAMQVVGTQVPVPHTFAFPPAPQF